MTPHGPPKLAPEGIPPEAALYLDNAAEYLKETARAYGLKLSPYDQHHPDHSAWWHGLYGEYHERELCIQVVTDEDMAPDFTARLKGYLRVSWHDGETVYPPNDKTYWLLFEERRVNGMVALLDGVAGMTEVLRLACTFRMPHPTDPDAKA